MEYLLKEIDVFVKIIDHGSFKGAAEALHLTQSAMTQRLKKLEDALGVRLIERTTRSVSPTVVGRSFLPVARRMLLQFDQSMTDLMEIVDGSAGHVTVASLNSVAAYILPDAIKRFGAENPQIGVRIIDDAAHEVAGHVRRGEAELGLDMLTAGADPDLIGTPVLDDPYALICPPDHPYAGRAEVAWAELNDTAVIMYGARSGTKQLLLSLSGKEAQSGASRFEVQHLSTLIGFVEAGVGVGIVPSMAVRGRANEAFTHVKLVEPDLKRTIMLIERRGIELSPAAEKLKQCLLQAFARRD